MGFFAFGKQPISLLVRYCNASNFLNMRLINLILLSFVILGCAQTSFSQTLNLTTNGQFVLLGDLDVAGTQITVEALVKKSSGNNVLSKHTDPSNVNYLLRVGTFELTTSTQFYMMINPYAGAMLANNWYHIAGTYDGSFIRYYVNGCLIIEEPASGTIHQSNLITAIGNISLPPHIEQYYGEIDELRIWSEARTAAQLSANMFDLPNPTTFPNLKAYYKFSGNLINSQGNATFDGTWNGTPSYGVQPLPSVIPSFSVQSITPTAVSCFGLSDGSISVTATGTNLRYSLDGVTWQVSNQFTGLIAGTYAVSVRTPEGCIITDATIVVTEPALVNASASNNGPYCAGQVIELIGSSTSTGTITYQWTGPGGFTSSVQNPTNATQSGVYSLVVTKGGCSSAPATTNLIVAPASPLTIAKTDISCFGLNNGYATVSTTTPGTHTYLWSPSGGTAATATGLSSGTYMVTVTNLAGCVSTITTTIVEPTILAVTANTTAVNCGSNDGTANASGAGGTGPYTYLWSPGGSTADTIKNLSVGMYSVTVSDAKGCTITVSTGVTQNGPLNLVVNPASAVIFEDESISLNATFTPFVAGSIYSWVPTSGLSCTDCPNPIATPGTTTTYYVTVTTPDGCTELDSAAITTKIRCGEYFIPTSFSPNGDGVNDEFKVYGKCIVSTRMRVYNRWGTKVYDSESLTAGWDGTLKGELMNVDSYVYQVDISFNDGRFVNESGNINLMR